MGASKFRNDLIETVSKCEKVKGVGQTGDIQADLIPGYSDIDLFILCSTVPSLEERQILYSDIAADCDRLTMNICHGGLWGVGDIFQVDGIDIMPMYFTVDEMDRYLTETLQGEHLETVGGFYPTGRLASIDTIHVFYEENAVWTSMKEKVKQYPKALFNKLYNYHISRVLDEEDLGRVSLRKDVLFYHHVLEQAIDHLLLALFAMNHTYFPSRKRTKEYIDSFEMKPNFFYDRLMETITRASSSDTIVDSVNSLRNIVAELAQLGDIK